MKLYGSERAGVRSPFGKMADLPTFARGVSAARRAIGQRSAQLAAAEVDLANLADPAEVNKGWFNHELDPDGQARMLAAEVPVVQLREARRRRGWTQLRVARLAGVSVSAVSVAERLVVGVSPLLRAKICRAVGVPS